MEYATFRYIDGAHVHTSLIFAHITRYILQCRAMLKIYLLFEWIHAQLVVFLYKITCTSLFTILLLHMPYNILNQIPLNKNKILISWNRYLAMRLDFEFLWSSGLTFGHSQFFFPVRIDFQNSTHITCNDTFWNRRLKCLS